MTKDDEREVQRKLRILQHAEKIGHVDRTCRYSGNGRANDISERSNIFQNIWISHDVAIFRVHIKQASAGQIHRNSTQRMLPGHIRWS